MDESYYLLTFPNAHTAMAAQKILQEKGIPLFMLPTLRELSDSCGLSIRFRPQDLGQVRRLLAEDALLKKNHQLYSVRQEKNQRQIKKV